jgi:hypothetical protein
MEYTMTWGASIIGYSERRMGPDGLVHIASRTTFENPYAGWWASRCGQSYVKAEKRVSRETRHIPTCLQCIGAPEPMVWRIPEDSWQKP